MSELIGPVANTGFTRLYQPVGEPTLEYVLGIFSLPVLVLTSLVSSLSMGCKDIRRPRGRPNNARREV